MLQPKSIAGFFQMHIDFNLIFIPICYVPSIANFKQYHFLKITVKAQCLNRLIHWLKTRLHLAFEVQKSSSQQLDNIFSQL
jgi:hypothetical protein